MLLIPTKIRFPNSDKTHDAVFDADHIAFYLPHPDGPEKTILLSNGGANVVVERSLDFTLFTVREAAKTQDAEEDAEEEDDD